MTQENNNYFFPLGSLWGLWGLSSPTRDQTHARCTWTSREVPISYSVKVILNSQVCRNNFLKYTLIYYFISFNTKNENYLGQEWKLLLSRQDMQCKNMYKHPKVPCVFTMHCPCTWPLKGTKRAQRAGLFLNLQCSHLSYISVWLCCKRRLNILKL